MASSCERSLRIPQACRKNAIFIIDAKTVASPEDVRSDINGVFRLCLEIKYFTVQLSTERGKPTISFVSRKKCPLKSGQMLMRVHRTENDHGLVLNIVYFQDAQGNIFKDSILLQYIINRKVCGDVESVVFEVPAHGNSDTVRGTPFHPLKKSTLAKIRKDVNTVGKVNSGAIYEASTSSTDNCDYGDLPRSWKQITDFASSARSRAHTASDNEVEMLLLYNSELEDDEIVFYHGDIPQDLWVIGTKRMLSELCQDSNGQPISVDAIFNHGAFEVTPLTYRHQLIVAKSKNTPGEYVPATMIGPTIIQHDKKEERYDRALREIARKTNLRTTKIGIITDGEEALINACKANFNKANMLRCTNHFR